MPAQLSPSNDQVRVVDGRSAHPEAGITLTELLIAAAVLGITIVAITALLAQTTQAYRVNEESSRRQQEIEAAVQILSYDLALAGYTGTDLASVSRTFGGSPTIEVRRGAASDGESDLLVVRYFEDASRSYGADAGCDGSFCVVTYDVDFDEEAGSLVLYRIASGPGAGEDDVRGIVQAVEDFFVVGVILRSGEVAPLGTTLPSNMAGLYMEITFENGGAWRFPIGIGNSQVLAGAGG